MIKSTQTHEPAPNDAATPIAPEFPGRPPRRTATSDKTPGDKADEGRPKFRRWKTRWAAAIGAVVLLVLAVALTIGIVIRVKKERALANETAANVNAPPRVEVVTVHQAAAETQRTLPGNAQAFLAAAIYGRVNGYLKTRLVDIGDKVKAGQLLGEISAPDTDAQLAQAKATLLQSKATLESNKASETYATAQELRYRTLLTPGAATEQAYENQLMTLRVDTANVHAMEAQIQSNIATIQQLSALVSFEKLTAPFDGVVTLRNVDPGDLITADNPSTERQLFRVAMIDPLRVFVEVPQVYSSAVKPGQTAILFRREDPQRLYQGKVTRTTNALNSSTRTLRTQVDVPNPKGELMPGMFLEVKFIMSREAIPVIVPSDAVIVRTGAPKVGVLDAQHKVHYQVVQLGRDFGATVEVLTGLRDGDAVIIHPGDDLAEGIEVQPVSREKNQQASDGGGEMGQTESGSPNGHSQQGHEKQSDEEGGSGEEGSQSGGHGAAGSGKVQSSQSEGVPEKQTSQTH